MLHSISNTHHFQSISNVHNETTPIKIQTVKDSQTKNIESDNEIANNNPFSNNAYYVNLSYGNIIENAQLVNHLDSINKTSLQKKLLSTNSSIQDMGKIRSYMYNHIWS